MTPNASVINSSKNNQPKLVLSSSLKTTNDKQISCANYNTNESIDQNENNKENFDQFISSTPISSSSHQVTKLKSNILPSAIKTAQTAPSMLNMVRKNNLIDKLNKDVISTNSILQKTIDPPQTHIQNSQSSPLVCQKLNQNNNPNLKPSENFQSALFENENTIENLKIIKQEKTDDEIIFIEDNLLSSQPLPVDMDHFKQSTQITSQTIPTNLSYEDLHKLSQTLLTCINQTQKNNNNIESNIDFISKISAINKQNTTFSLSNLNMNKNFQQNTLVTTSTPVTQKNQLKLRQSNSITKETLQNKIQSNKTDIRNTETNNKENSNVQICAISNDQVKVSSLFVQENLNHSNLALKSTSLTQFNSKQSDLIIENRPQNKLLKSNKANLPILSEFTTISPLKNSNINEKYLNSIEINIENWVDIFDRNNEKSLVSPPIELIDINKNIELNIAQSNESVIIPNTYQSSLITPIKNHIVSNANNSVKKYINVNKKTIEKAQLDTTLKETKNNINNNNNQYDSLVKLKNKDNNCEKKRDYEKIETSAIKDKNKVLIKASSIINNNRIFEETPSDTENESNERFDFILNKNNQNFSKNSNKLSQNVTSKQDDAISSKNVTNQNQKENKMLNQKEITSSQIDTSSDDENESTLVLNSKNYNSVKLNKRDSSAEKSNKNKPSKKIDSSIGSEEETKKDDKSRIETRNYKKIESPNSKKFDCLNKKSIAKIYKSDLLIESEEESNKNVKCSIHTRKENLEKNENRNKNSNRKKSNQIDDTSEDESDRKEIEKKKKRIDQKETIVCQDNIIKSLAQFKNKNEERDEIVFSKNKSKRTSLLNDSFDSIEEIGNNHNEKQKDKRNEIVQVNKKNISKLESYKNPIVDKYDLYDRESESEVGSYKKIKSKVNNNIEKMVQNKNKNDAKVSKAEPDTINSTNSAINSKTKSNGKHLKEITKNLENNSTKKTEESDEKQFEQSESSKRSKFPKLKSFTIDYQEKEKLKEHFFSYQDDLDYQNKIDTVKNERKDELMKTKKNDEIVKEIKTSQINTNDLYQVESDEELVIKRIKKTDVKITVASSSIDKNNLSQSESEDEMIQIKSKNKKIVEIKTDKNKLEKRLEINIETIKTNSSMDKKDKKRLFEKSNFDNENLDFVSKKGSFSNQNKRSTETKNKNDTKIVEITSNNNKNRDEKSSTRNLDNFDLEVEKHTKLTKSKPKQIDSETRIKNFEPKAENNMRLRPNVQTTIENVKRETKLKEKPVEKKTESTTASNSKAKKSKRKSTDDKNDLEAHLLEEPLLKIPKLLKEELEKIERHNQKILASKISNKVYIIDSNSESDDELILNKQNEQIKNKKNDKDKETSNNNDEHNNKMIKRKIEEEEVKEEKVKKLSSKENNKQKTIESYFSNTNKKNNTKEKSKNDLVELKSPKSNNKKSNMVVSSDDESIQKEVRNKKSNDKKQNEIKKNDVIINNEEMINNEANIENEKFKVPLLPPPNSLKKPIVLKTNKSIVNETKKDININNFFSPEICKKHFMNASALKKDLSLSASKLLTSFDSTKTSISNTTANTTFKKRIVLKMNTSTNSPNNNVTPKRVDYLSEMLKSANKNRNSSKF
jgi:hypothetical protein